MTDQEWGDLVASIAKMQAEAAQFKMDVVAPRSKARQNGQTLEIDVLA